MSKSKLTMNLPLFQINNDILDYVHTYKYLGIVISSDGRLSKVFHVFICFITTTM